MPEISSSRHGQMPMRSAFGHGMCQNMMIVARGSVSRIMRGARREVVVLHQHDRVVAIDLLAHRVGELAVHRDVVGPVLGAEHRARVRDVAERPQPLVGEAVVVALLFLLGEPDAPQQVGAPRRAAPGSRSLMSTVSRSAEPLPCATQTPEHARITGSSAVTRPLAGWSTLIAVVRLHVHVRLAVGEDHDALALQELAQRRAQAGRAPDAGDALALLRPAARPARARRASAAGTRPWRPPTAPCAGPRSSPSTRSARRSP